MIANMVMETVPLTELSSRQVRLRFFLSCLSLEKMRPSGTVNSLVFDIVWESLQVPPSEHQDLASSSGIALKLLILNPASILILTVHSYFSGITLPPSTGTVDADIVLEPAASCHAIAVGIYQRQLCGFLKEVVSSLLHDLPAFEVVIVMLEGLDSSIRCFNPPLVIA